MLKIILAIQTARSCSYGISWNVTNYTSLNSCYHIQIIFHPVLPNVQYNVVVLQNKHYSELSYNLNKLCNRLDHHAQPQHRIPSKWQNVKGFVCCVFDYIREIIKKALQNSGLTATTYSNIIVSKSSSISFYASNAYFIQPENHHWGQTLCLNLNQEIQPFSSDGMQNFLHTQWNFRPYNLQLYQFEVMKTLLVLLLCKNITDLTKPLTHDTLTLNTITGFSCYLLSFHI